MILVYSGSERLSVSELVWYLVSVVGGFLWYMGFDFISGVMKYDVAGIVLVQVV